MKTVEEYEELIEKIAACTNVETEKNPYLNWVNNLKPEEMGVHLSFTFYVKKLIDDFYKSEKS